MFVLVFSSDESIVMPSKAANRKLIIYISICRRTSKRELQEGHFDTLLHFSVIRRGGMGSTRSSIEEFCFALPYCGEFVRSIDTGRCELINIIRRSRHGEMLGSKLDNVKLRKSSMSVQWHVKDLLGSGDLERLETTVGTLFRLV